MDLNLKGKVALVTGASRGIGRAIAYGFAAEGAHLAICSRTEPSIKDTARDLANRYQIKVHWEARDLLTAGSAEQFIERTIQRLGCIDILVNNVGTSLGKPFAELTGEEWQHLLDLNLKVAVRCCQQVLPMMKQRGTGRIVNISALSGRVPRLGQIGSNVAKAALINFTESLAREVAADGIRVNAVCPAAVMTERWEARINRMAKERKEDFATTSQKVARGGIPVGRFGTPEDVASAVVFLASEKADFITGDCLMVDGGIGRGVSLELK